MKVYRRGQSCSCPLSSVGGQCHTLAALPLGKRPGIHFTGGWVGLRASLDEYGKYFPWPVKLIVSCYTNYVTLAAAIPNKVKVQFTLEQAIKAQRGSRDIATLALTSALDGGGW
jgi:hypothetical protein